MADALEATIDSIPSAAPAEKTVDPEVLQRRQYNRREFMTYAFAGGTGLLLGAGGYLSFVFLYPRFREGEFGGDFPLEGDPPPYESAPQPVADGKFWLVTTEEGDTKAIYMVCTHLGCLYKWVDSNWRFECPCHGSKFTHDGLYIEGPAGRSLDYFEIDNRPDGSIAVKTGSKVLGSPASESPAKKPV